ncbi:DUF6390 family protein [Patescibacteria group bacterium]
MSGLKLAALYGIKPHLLGFCGPREESSTRVLLNYLSGKKVSEKKVRKILTEFEGAMAYYNLIAQCNNIKDPFNEKVVKAYWIGNELLDSVSTESLQETIKKEFSRPGLLSKKAAAKKTKKVAKGSVPHHSFHVMKIGSVTGRIRLQGKLRDVCRIGWGKVITLDPLKNRMKVIYQPLTGKKNKKYIGWNKDLLKNPRVGSFVSIHWNMAIQILQKKDLKNLQKYTQQTLKRI